MAGALSISSSDEAAMGKKTGRAQQRGRRCLVWAGLCFLFIQLGAGLLLDWFGLPIRFPHAVAAFKRAQGQPADILCFGSSRFEGGLCDSQITADLRRLTGDGGVQVVNVAVPAGDLLVTEFMLHRLLQLGVCPRLAVIEVSPETLGRTNTWMREHVRRQVGWPDVLAALPDCLRAGELLRLAQARLVPLYVQRYRLWHELARLYEEGWDKWAANYRLARLAESGSGQPAAGSDNAAAEGRSAVSCPLCPVPSSVPAARCPLPAAAGSEASAATQSGLYSLQRSFRRRYEVGGGSAAALERVLACCRRHNIAVLLVAPPVIREHRALYLPAIDTVFLGCMRRLEQAGACAFVDCRTWVPDPLFLDNHHLLPEGGAYFSSVLARTILAPAWMQLRAVKGPARRRHRAV
jgi:hypothetical protein